MRNCEAVLCLHEINPHVLVPFLNFLVQSTGIGPPRASQGSFRDQAMVSLEKNFDSTFWYPLTQCQTAAEMHWIVFRAMNEASGRGCIRRWT